MKDFSDTQTKILDTAEHLFAREGFGATSLRTITREAGVNLASVNYHFGSKDALLDAVIRRRLVPLNEIRIRRLREILDSAIEQGKRPPVGSIIMAFAEPTLRFRDSGPGAEAFISIIGRAMAAYDEKLMNIFLHYMGPVFKLFSECMREALPDMPENTFRWRLQFTVGVLAHTMHVCCKGHSGPIEFPRYDGAEAMIGIIVPYLTAGLEAPWQ